MHKAIQKQFDTRNTTFNISANWITDKKLISTHIELAGKPKEKALELCCGTGIVGSALTKAGWNVIGVDVSKKMCEEAGKNFPTLLGQAEDLLFKNNVFDVVVMRQALFFLDINKALQEIHRVLKKNGLFILSQTIPFSGLDEPWLKKVHKKKQAQLKKFFNGRDLENELKRNEFFVEKKVFLRIRESVTRWMKFAPELSKYKKEEICNLVLNSPPEYKKTRNVKLVNNEIFEDWNWIVFKAKKIS